jgi:hypothetical protein
VLAWQCLSRPCHWVALRVETIYVGCVFLRGGEQGAGGMGQADAGLGGDVAVPFTSLALGRSTGEQASCSDGEERQEQGAC